MIIESFDKDEERMLIKQKLINVLTRNIYTDKINELIENYEIGPNNVWFIEPVDA